MLLSIVFFNTILSNLFNTDTKGTERSVHIREVSVLERTIWWRNQRNVKNLAESAYEIGNRTLKNRLLFSSLVPQAFWSNYYRFLINMVFAAWKWKINWKYNFGVFPGWGICTAFLSPFVGHLQLFQNKMTNTWQMPLVEGGAMGTLGIDWAIREYNFARKVVYFAWYIISTQNSPKIVRKCRATRNFSDAVTQC